MNKEFADEWVAALKSGKYTQCSGVLHDGNGFCCLGVAELVAGSDYYYDDINENGRFGEEENAFVLTIETLKASGIADNSGAPRDSKTIKVGGGFYQTLSEANDEGRTFTEIADAIEANWERL